ncbi:MAG: hypothetical protein KDA87_06745 [Planctomycetales bacterium]|nr:hypothetical protein [Planctomycetales bacterium]
MLTAAYVDILILADESNSQGPGGPGDDVAPWIVDIVDRLETKLVSRQIGGDLATQGNRYAVIGFGDTNPYSIKMLNNQPWVAAEDVDQLVSQFSNIGHDENPYIGLAHALGVDDVQIWGTPTTIAPELQFRPNAAVHVIMVSDEVSDTWEHNFGPEVGPSGCLDVSEEVSPVCENNIFFELLNQMRAENLPTTGAPSLVDAVFTSVAPYEYNESSLGVSGEMILGIDAHILDNVNLDRNSADSNDPQEQDLDADILSGSPNDNFAIFTGTETVDDIDVIVRDSATASDQLLNVDYDDLRSVIRNANEDAINYVQLSTGVSPAFDAEDYAIFTWEARGTAWDFEVIRGKYSQNPLPNIVENFNKALVDDTFEKIRMQVVDFDESGRVSLEDELDDYWTAGLAVANGNTNYDARRYDLDGDGTFVTENFEGNDSMQQNDILLLLHIMSTPIGDSDANYQFNTSDGVLIFQGVGYEDQIDDNADYTTGDWTGDFDFGSSDMIAIYTYGLVYYENGYIDNDGDGVADVVPIWAININFTGDDNTFYLPVWSS